MKTEYNTSFKSKEFKDYRNKIIKKSNKLINKLKEKSLIQVGDIADVPDDYLKSRQLLKVVEIKVFSVSSFGEPTGEISFEYYGLPLRKDGEVMRNRKPVWFNSFIKNGIKYVCASCLRIELVPQSFENGTLT